MAVNGSTYAKMIKPKYSKNNMNLFSSANSE